MEFDFGRRLKQARQQKEWTQKELSEKAGVSQNSLSAYENLGKIPSLEVGARIAEALDVSLDWLCGLSEQTGSIPSMKTYGDVYRMLLDINASFPAVRARTETLPAQSDPTIDAEEAFDAYYGVDANTGDEYWVDSSWGILEIRDSRIANFLLGWTELSRLSRERIVQQEVLDAWLWKRIDGGDRLPLHEYRDEEEKRVLWFGET